MLADGRWDLMERINIILGQSKAKPPENRII
jgi:hypothetical protein